ncbi:UDP-glucose/GDP-mannose dehydrogenase family protein [Desulfobotulus sp. H1]|uniref:UDP-glucose 6-dehydrogenase n=1 Tax=Desulfobotulus pelophilus TaxID=2823377 RepID=A0ABT3N7T5_9BACT|nr:UDP-glucose/GDP-mannose dehydrogenase family protein [Desulfobotulus pelophilus]MCW7753510.1 UDP-glucose/GDP-mannose dehydrogenase family protein [Desulfobotulus pelophilus]
MDIIVIGTGYVGLVTGVCLAEMGNRVTCVDRNPEKIQALEKGLLPIYEPGLGEMMQRNMASKNLFFTTNLTGTMNSPCLCFIAVGTPPRTNGAADIRQVMSVADDIARHMKAPVLVVNKTTAPVGTCDAIIRQIRMGLAARNKTITFDVASNPEFLKEGDAVADFMRPDRIIIGLSQQKAAAIPEIQSQEILSRLYAPFSRNHHKIIFMGMRDAEMTKYAANCMLATKISFMNEMASICENVGADVERVRRGMGADSRIGYDFIYAGCGYGGSCFPKDIQALIRAAEDMGITPDILKAVEKRNFTQKKRLFEKALAFFGGNLSGRHFAIWGLAFKPGTDDMREAPSLSLIQSLMEAGASLVAYDPVAMDTAKAILPSSWLASGRMAMAEHQYAALQGVDALFLVTEWKPFRQPDFAAMKRLMKQPVIFDGRNQFDPEELAKKGFDYKGIGRGRMDAGQDILECTAQAS